MKTKEKQELSCLHHQSYFDERSKGTKNFFVVVVLLLYYTLYVRLISDIKSNLSLCSDIMDGMEKWKIRGTFFAINF